MVSGYLNRTRSLEELDALFEKDRQAAVKLAEIVFSQEVAVAVRAVADINEISNARIQADAQIASAKLASSAEVHATTLLAAAETLRLSIQRHELTDKKSDEIDSSIVSELAAKTGEQIQNTSRSAIEQIKAEAQAAVAQISENSKRSIAEIRAICENIKSQIDDNARLAEAKLRESKNYSRTPESVVFDAEKAAQHVMNQAASATQTLQVVLTDTTDKMTQLADAACASISATVSSATERVLHARDKALARINEILALRQS